MRILFFLLFPLCLTAASEKLHYDVRFYGVNDNNALKMLESSSELLLLRERPPATLNALQYRVKADIPNLLNVLKALSYYEAEISYEIETLSQGVQIHLYVHLGSPFLLRSYEVFHGECQKLLQLSDCPICLKDLGLEEGQRAQSTAIVQAEKAVLTQLAYCGYPLASIDKRRIIADMADESIDAAVCVQEGPLSKFGPTSFFGLKEVNPRFIERKVAWREGETFNLGLVEETQNRLLKTDLFSSVMVSYDQELDNRGELPMKVRLSEAKHKSISLGAFYATVDGPGGSISWSNRNFRKMGEELALDANASERFIGGVLVYRKPDFLSYNQSISFSGEASRENIVPYLAFTYGESNQIEKKIDKKRTFTAALKGEYISVHESAQNGTYFLLSLPIYAKYSNSNSPVNPTEGLFIAYGATPYQSLQKTNVQFIKQRLVMNLYLPMTKKQRVSLALHAELGSIAGTDQKNIPLPKLFLGGSMDDLRGYTYKTVSPLDQRGAPRGGRSAIFTSIELRLRLSESLGLVPFADFGTVSLEEWPQVKEKWYKSVGGGVRYFTFFGPLRLDVGWPLDRRKGLDTWGKVYASIGQSF